MALLYVYWFPVTVEEKGVKVTKDVCFYAPELSEAEDQYKKLFEVTVAPKLLRRERW